MITRAAERGFLLVAAVALIALGALMAIALATLTAGGSRSGAEQLASTQAFYAAEAGFERALYGYSKQGVACAGLVYSGAVGNASYSTTGALYNTSSALPSAMDATQTYVPIAVASLASYADFGQVSIGAERINYARKSTSAADCGGASSCLAGAQRGAEGTVATTHSAGASVVQNQCLISATGTVSSGEAERIIKAMVRLGAGVNLFGDATGEGHFPDNADFTANWATEVLTSSAGSSRWDTDNCPASVCANTVPGTGSFYMETTPGGPNDIFAGYRQRTLSTAITGGQNVDVEVGYLLSGNNINPNTTLSVTLFDSAASVETTLWSITTGTATSGWVLGTATNVALPAGRTYDRIRLRFSLREQGNNQVIARFDHIRVNRMGGSVGSSGNVVYWREHFP